MSMEKLIGAQIQGATSHNTAAFAMSSAGALPDVGHSLLLAVRCGSSNSINTTFAGSSNGITDTKGNTWTYLGGSGAYASGANVYLFACTPSAAYLTTDTVTVNLNASSPYMSVIIGQWPNGTFATPDGAITVANAASGTSKAVTATPPTAGDECITAFANGQTTSGSVSLSPTTGALGFTLEGSTLNCGLGELNTPWTSGANPDPTWNWTTSSGVSAILAFFKAGPVANAGPDQLVGLGETVTLNASASSGSGNTYAWTCTSGPHNGNTLTGATPTFAAGSTAGADVWSVTATDSGSRTSTDTVSIVISANIRLMWDGAEIISVRRVTLKPDGTMA